MSAGHHGSHYPVPQAPSAEEPLDTIRKGAPFAHSNLSDAPPQLDADSSHFNGHTFPYHHPSHINSSPHTYQHSYSFPEISPSGTRGTIASLPTGSHQRRQDTLPHLDTSSVISPSADFEDVSPGFKSDVERFTGAYDDFGLISPGAADGSDLGGRRMDEENGRVPAWSELKTKAGKERRRLPLACIACRRKKIRCSGEKPACKHCLRTRTPCVYKVTTRKAAPRTDYMAMLDKRMKRMEDRIIKIVPNDEQDQSPNITRARVKPAIPGTVPIRSAGAKKRAAEEAFVAEMETWSKPTSNSPALKPLSLIRQEAEASKLYTEGAEALPSSELQEHLCQVFFENVYGQAYHLLHKPSFMRKLKAGTVPPVLVLSICAVSARFSSHPKVNGGTSFLRGEEWAAEARDIVLKRYDSPSVTILICLLILALHEFGTCRGGRSWALGGSALRMCYALQLHKDLDHDPLNRNGSVELSSIDREIRRRTMWACFFMDRFMSSGTDRPSFIKEETIKIQLPVKEKLFRLDVPGPTEDLNGKVLYLTASEDGHIYDVKQNMGVAAFIVRSIALWGRIVSYWNLGGYEQDSYPMWHPDSIATDLQNQTIALTESLPDFLKYSTDNLHSHEAEGLANQFIFFHIIVQQNILFMNKFSIHGVSGRKMGTMPQTFVMDAGYRAYAAANRISEILGEGEAYSVSAPFAGYCSFLSSTVHIFGIFSGSETVAIASKSHLATNYRYLNKMKRYWGMFYYMIENLKDQYQVCAEAASGRGSSTQPTTIFQYGDWFDRYPHGINLGEFVEQTLVKTEPDVNALASALSTNENPLQTLQQDDRPTSTKPKKKPKRQASLSHNQVEQSQNTGQGASTTHLTPLQTNPLQSDYSQVSPSQPVDMYNHPPNTMFGYVPPQHQGMLHQLDRQLVFGAYGTSPVDPALQASGVITTPQSWDMQMGGMPSYTAEPSSAWFMPFNLEPPETGHDNEAYNKMGGPTGMGYDPSNVAGRHGGHDMGNHRPGS